MANFDFLKDKKEYALFASACIDAEKIFHHSYAMSAAGCRKALELAIKWVYAAEKLSAPYQDNLSAYLFASDFKYKIVKYTVWEKLPYIHKLGNSAVHNNRKIDSAQATVALRNLFEFIQWIDHTYGDDYVERKFAPQTIPTEKSTDSLLLSAKEAELTAKNNAITEKDELIKQLMAQISAQSETLIASKPEKDKKRGGFRSDISEYETRKQYINLDLALMGWKLGKNAKEEVKLSDGSKADYVLYNDDGRPIAVVEAKKTSRHPVEGREQANRYAATIEKDAGIKPLVFATNGFDTEFWDDMEDIPRKVSGIFSKDDLERIIQRRSTKLNLDTVAISDKITDRYYQKEAIRAVTRDIEGLRRRHLLAMATGTGKTRTAASLVDVLSRGRYITNVLFLADRRALVKQAHSSFKSHLPSMTLCNLLDNKADKNARIVFSTYQTIINAIDTVKNDNGATLFSPAHFDLIIIDEAHRNIFKKYRVIFDYFYAHLVGLTATPNKDIDRNTYDFFELEEDTPTYPYDYETAVYKDSVLVPYYNIETASKIIDEGIRYDELSEREKERYEEDFADEEGNIPEAILPEHINDYVFNQETIDEVLKILMTKGIKINGGNHVGKTIIFACNNNHALRITERFNKLYPQLKGSFAKTITYKEERREELLEEFKVPDKPPYIAVSVDMLDTGIDVEEIVNLVFFKQVRSKIKFWQMIGRGTRLCPELECIDSIEGSYLGKKRFYIFDFLRNFEFFRENPNEIKADHVRSLDETIFIRRIQLICALQNAKYIDEEHSALRRSLVGTVLEQMNELNYDRVEVRQQRKYIENYRNEKAFEHINDDMREDLCKYIAPLIVESAMDEYPRRFDSLMYDVMLGITEGKDRGKSRLKTILDAMLKRGHMPQIKEKLDVIKPAASDVSIHTLSLLQAERLRIELRHLLALVVDKPGNKPVDTNLTDVFTILREGEELENEDLYVNYRLKVESYIREHQDHIAIYKLRNNIPLNQNDYSDLQKILIGDLGSADDYKREFGDTPLGLLVRKVAHMERGAAMTTFSGFINSENLSHEQIAFVNKIIDYVSQNGYLENPAELTKPPFDKPVSFFKLFDDAKQQKIVNLVTEIKENAKTIATI